jgi:hypothetical protein
MKNLFLLLVASIVIFISCAKENNDEVLIRIKNNSHQNFLYSATVNVNFGSINAGLMTDYKAFNEVVAFPGARIVIESDTIYTGLLYCGTPPIPMLSKGKYTLEISADSSSFTGFSNKFIKD